MSRSTRMASHGSGEPCPSIPGEPSSRPGTSPMFSAVKGPPPRIRSPRRPLQDLVYLLQVASPVQQLAVRPDQEVGRHRADRIAREELVLLVGPVAERAMGPGQLSVVDEPAGLVRVARRDSGRGSRVACRPRRSRGVGGAPGGWRRTGRTRWPRSRGGRTDRGGWPASRSRRRSSGTRCRGPCPRAAGPGPPRR